MVAEALLTSKNQEWETPPQLFDAINKSYNFTLDACASEVNKKCQKYFTKEDDGLSKSWKNERVWLNPPYQNSKPGQIDWVRKAYHEVKDNNCELVCCLLPARTDTKLFHDYVMKSSFVYFIKGRLKFVGATAGAVFPSMLVLFEANQFRQNPQINYSAPPVFISYDPKIV